MKVGESIYPGDGYVRYDFTVSETDVLRAVFSERVHFGMKNNEHEKLQRFELMLANWPIGTAVALETTNLGETTDELEAFCLRTEDVLHCIPRQSRKSAAGYVAIRTAMSDQAAELLGQFDAFFADTQQFELEDIEPAMLQAV
jgi:hypothetical protein